jgi:uncharacterized protein with GYD domain
MRRDAALPSGRRRRVVAKYLFTARYVGKGIEGLIKEGGTARRQMAAQALSSVGGNLESFYFAFGDDDVLGIVDLPDVSSAAAFSLTINAAGAVSLKLKPLITPEEMDAATKKKATYRPPGA